MAQQLQGLVSQFKVEGGEQDVKALPGAKAEKMVRTRDKIKTEAGKAKEEVTEITLKADAA